jgi:hypothetical protein
MIKGGWKDETKKRHGCGKIKGNRRINQKLGTLQMGLTNI